LEISTTKGAGGPHVDGGWGWRGPAPAGGRWPGRERRNEGGADTF